jgi:hypothetical protein
MIPESISSRKEIFMFKIIFLNEQGEWDRSCDYKYFKIAQKNLDFYSKFYSNVSIVEYTPNVEKFALLKLQLVQTTIDFYHS